MTAEEVQEILDNPETIVHGSSDEEPNDIPALETYPPEVVKVWLDTHKEAIDKLAHSLVDIKEKVESIKTDKTPKDKLFDITGLVLTTIVAILLVITLFQ